MRDRKNPHIVSANASYATKYSRKWRSEGRTIARLKKAGWVVFSIAHDQRLKNREFRTEIPSEVSLIAANGKEAKIVVVRSGNGLSEKGKERARAFAKLAKPLTIELWTWPVLAREPEIERI